MPNIYADENVVPRMTTRSSSKSNALQMLDGNVQGGLKHSHGGLKQSNNGGLKQSNNGGLKQSNNGGLKQSNNKGLKQSNNNGKLQKHGKENGRAVLSDVTNQSGLNEIMESPEECTTMPMCISSNLKEMSLSKRKLMHDIDGKHAEDELRVAEYAEDICTYYLQLEKYRMPDAAYMERQEDINSKMRAILVDWLVDVHFKYSLEAQTLHITLSLIDRFLDKDPTVKRQKLQLVGITAMFIAAKYEEIYPPEVSEFVRITDNAYDVDMVFQMEERMLKTLSFRVSCPTIYQFLTRFIAASGTNNKQTIAFAHYVIDRTLQEYRLLKYPPSAIAAAAMHIARMQMQETPVWHATLEHHSTYSEACLLPCAREIKEIMWSVQNGIGKSSKLTAVKRKYAKEKFHSVSIMELADHQSHQ